LQLRQASWQQHWHIRNRVLVSGHATWSAVDAIMLRMHKEEGKPDRSFLQFLDGMQCSGEVRSAALGYVEGYNAASADRISVQGLIQSENASVDAGGEAQYRFVSGYSQLIDGFLKDLPKETVRLGHVVKEVKWSTRKAEVLCQIGTAGTRRFTAKGAVVTLPLSILQADLEASAAVRFLPTLPMKEQALKRLVMGKATRVALLFKRCFWQDEANTNNIGFVHCDDEFFPTWWTQPLERPMPIAWASGRYAEKMEFETDEVVAERALNALCNWLPVNRSVVDDYLLGWRMHNWQTDPYSLGAYSYPAVGGLDAQKELAAPVDSTLFFAGEATDTTGNFGTVHGAIATGKRAAKEVLNAIR
jgi:monoamine oxidase